MLRDMPVSDVHTVDTDMVSLVIVDPEAWKNSRCWWLVRRTFTVPSFRSACCILGKLFQHRSKMFRSI